MKCKVVIFGEDKTQKFSCEGELILRKAGFSLSYVFDGNKCLLSYDGEILYHQQKGEIPVNLEFVANKKTLCKIGEGNFCGEFPVLTHILQVQLGTQNISVNVVYELNGDKKQMQIFAEFEGV